MPIWEHPWEHRLLDYLRSNPVTPGGCKPMACCSMPMMCLPSSLIRMPKCCELMIAQVRPPALGSSRARPLRWGVTDWRGCGGSVQELFEEPISRD